MVSVSQNQFWETAVPNRILLAVWGDGLGKESKLNALYCSDEIAVSQKLDQLGQPVDSFARQSFFLWELCKCCSESQFYNIPGKGIYSPSTLCLPHQHIPLTFFFSLFHSVGPGNAMSGLPKFSLLSLQLLMVFTYVSADTWISSRISLGRIVDASK